MAGSSAHVNDFLLGRDNGEGQAGRITSTQSPARQVQLGVRITF
jgi:hypothetical protein